QAGQREQADDGDRGCGSGTTGEGGKTCGHGKAPEGCGWLSWVNDGLRGALRPAGEAATSRPGQRGGSANREDQAWRAGEQRPAPRGTSICEPGLRPDVGAGRS